MPQGIKESHESYGMLQFSRTSHGGDTILFGSSIPHRETIHLRICPGTIERDLHRDWYYASEGRAYVDVEMSQAQFAEAITSMNQGSGVPVTIRRINGKRVEDPGFTNKRIQFEKEFEAKMQNLEAKLSKLTEEAEDILNNKKSFNKADRETILKQLYSFTQEIHSNIPFMASSYNEEMDKITKEAKAEVEAFTINKLNQLGLTKLDELKQLSQNINPKQIENK